MRFGSRSVIDCGSMRRGNCGQMQSRRFAQCRSGLTIELESTPDGSGGDVRRCSQHHRRHILHQPLVGSGYEHALDELSARPVITGLDADRHCLKGGAPLRRENKRRVDYDYRCDAVGMGGG